MSLFRMLLTLRTSAGDKLELDPGTLPFGPSGGDQPLTVRANRKWTLSVEDETNDEQEP